MLASGAVPALRMARRAGLSSSLRFPLLFTVRPFALATRPLLQAAAADYYRTLGVSQSATHDEIKAAYKKRALKCHPDINKAPNAEEQFKEISEAYAVLGNTDKRAEYDGARRFGGGGGGPAHGFGGAQGKRTYAGAYPAGGGPSFSSGPGGGGQFRTMTAAEADQIFREMFRGVDIEKLVKEMEMGSRGGGGGAFPFASNAPPGYQQSSTRPNFYSNESVESDGRGNTTVKRGFVDANGNIFNIFTTTSDDPRASMNQSQEDADERYFSTRTGRTQYGFGTSHDSGGPSARFANGAGGDSWAGNPLFRTLRSNSPPGTSLGRVFLLAMALTIMLGAVLFVLTSPIFWLIAIVLVYLRLSRRF